MHNHIILTRTAPSQISLAMVMIAVSIFGACLNAKADKSLPTSTPDFPSLVRAHSNQLANIVSDKEAENLFVSAIGPALQMGDVARTLGPTPLSATLTNELLMPELKAAVHRLMGNLAAWRLSSTVKQAVKDQQIQAVSEGLLESPHKAWLDQQGKAPWHDSLNQMSDVMASSEWTKGNLDGSAPTLLVTVLEHAARMEVDALQASYQEWDRIRSWKDRVRGLRGQARLCGTWQWIIHNHQQQHREQKLLLLFPPPGHTPPTLPGLVETIVVGENVYLRWEVDGRVQEDSLQFNKDGQRLEGTFMNSQGGWGSISGKKMVGCVS